MLSIVLNITLYYATLDILYFHPPSIVNCLEWLRKKMISRFVDLYLRNGTHEK